MRRIPLTRGYYAQVDDEDYDRVARFTWVAVFLPWDDRVFALRNYPRGDGKYGKQFLHRFIVKAGPREVIVPIDGDGLNCQKDNLRCHSSRKGLCWRPDKKTGRQDIVGHQYR
jgi:hypothetical protein